MQSRGVSLLSCIVMLCHAGVIGGKTRIFTKLSSPKDACTDVGGDMIRVLSDGDTHMYLGRKICDDLRRQSKTELAQGGNPSASRQQTTTHSAPRAHGHRARMQTHAQSSDRQLPASPPIQLARLGKAGGLGAAAPPSPFANTVLA